MLKAQNIPTEFQNSKIMQEVIDKEYDGNIKPLKLSMNFDMEDSRKSREPGNCLACGNCLAGCSYNAKNSTDKTYLVSAIEVCLYYNPLFSLNIMIHILKQFNFLDYFHRQDVLSKQNVRFSTW